MPKRGISTSSPKDFEPKRKNPISLGSDSNMDNDLKPLKIGGETTPLKISKDTIEISSKLLVDSKEVLAGNIEGTGIKSTGETGGTKFLREDGDGTCSWQTSGGSSTTFRFMINAGFNYSYNAGTLVYIPLSVIWNERSGPASSNESLAFTPPYDDMLWTS